MVQMDRQEGGRVEVQRENTACSRLPNNFLRELSCQRVSYRERKFGLEQETRILTSTDCLFLRKSRCNNHISKRCFSFQKKIYIYQGTSKPHAAQSEGDVGRNISHGQGNRWGRERCFINTACGSGIFMCYLISSLNIYNTFLYTGA